MWVRLASADAQQSMPGHVTCGATRAVAGTWINATVDGGRLKYGSWVLFAEIVTEYWIPEGATPPVLSVLENARRVPTEELEVTEVFDVPLRDGDYVYSRATNPRTYTVSAVRAAESRRERHRLFVSGLSGDPDNGYLTPEMFAPGPGRDALWPNDPALLATAEPCLHWAPHSTTLEPGCSWISIDSTPVPVSLLKAAVERRRAIPPDAVVIRGPEVFVLGEPPLPFRRGYITPRMFLESPERDAFFAWARKAEPVVPFDVATAEYRVGFELETQRSMGLVFRDEHPRTVADTQAALLAAPISWISRALPNVTAPPLTSTLESLLTHPEVVSYAQDRLPRKSAEELVQAKIAEDGRGLHVKQDGSVSGFEFTTLDGGLPLDAAKDVARYVLDPSWNHEIDPRCSFHIHVSSTTPHSVWRHATVKFQLACMEYLAVHLDEVPAAVRERWQCASQRAAYFALECNTAKRKCFVAWRGRTWEFRCWGNVSTAEDAERCLDLTVRAFKYAIQRAQGARSLSPRVSLDKVKAAIESNTPLARRARRSPAPSAA